MRSPSGAWRQAAPEATTDSRLAGALADPLLIGSARRGRLDHFLRSQRPHHWVLSVIVLLVAVNVGYSVVHNANFQWNVVGSYLFDRQIMLGLGRTLELTAVSAALGFVLSIVLAVMRLSGAPLASGAAWLYVWFFRGTPLLVQLIFWFNFGALYRHIGIGIPFGPTFFRVDSTSMITAYTAAIFGLGLNSAAYMSEVVRAGILSIHHGQAEAAHALGLSQFQVLRHVLIPQAMRVIVPPVSNEVIGMLKYSSLVSVLAVPELLYTAQLIYARNFETIPLLIVVSLWYIFFTTILTIVQHYLERYFGRGVRRTTRIESRADDLEAAPASAIGGNR